MKWMKSMQRFSLTWNANCRIESHLLITQPCYSNSMRSSGFTLFCMLRPHCQQLHLFAHARYVLCSYCIAPWWKTHIAFCSVLKLSFNKSRYHAVTTVNVCSGLCILSINTVFFEIVFSRDWKAEALCVCCQQKDDLMLQVIALTYLY